MKMQLRQFRLLGGNTTFELGNYLTIRYTSLIHSSETIYDLSRIAPTPNRTRYVPVGWVIAAIFFATYAAYGVSEGWLTGKTGAPSGFFTLAGCFAICAWFAWRKYRNFLVFMDKFTNEPAIAIWRSNPSVKAVDQFVSALAESCTRSRVPFGASEVETVEFYIQSLQLLLNNGVLIDKEYQAALERLRLKHAPATVLSLVTNSK